MHDLKPKILNPNRSFLVCKLSDSCCLVTQSNSNKVKGKNKPCSNSIYVLKITCFVESGKLMVNDSPATFKLHANGHRHLEGAVVTMTLLRRHEMVIFALLFLVHNYMIPHMCDYTSMAKTGNLQIRLMDSLQKTSLIILATGS